MTTIATNVTTAGNQYTSETWPAQPPGAYSQPQAANASAAGATTIQRLGFETVALVTSTSVSGSETNDGTTITNTNMIAGVSLPANAQVGDAVVVLLVGISPGSSGAFNVWVPVGHYLGTQLNGFGGGAGVYQMVSPGVWYQIP
jgi:hypothetical protein